MPEIKHPIQRLTEGETYTAGPDQFLITEDHTIADILRFAATQAGGMNEVITLAAMLAEEA